MTFSSASTPVPDYDFSVVPVYHSNELVLNRHSPAKIRAFELKLMHYFTAYTSSTLSTSPNQQRTWAMDIPTIAYDCQCLMDAILAVAALHLRYIYPEDPAFVSASHGYMASALAQYSVLLKEGVSKTNADGLFSTAALIAFQASAARRFEVDSSSGYTLPLAWFHSFQGVKTVVMSSWQFLRNSEKVFPIITGQPPLLLDMVPDRRAFFAPILDGMDAQIETLPEKDRAEVKQAYEHSVAFLNWAHRKPDAPRILSFAATVSRRFVDLITSQDPRALVIIACFFAMTKKVDNVWWLEGVAKREVMGILTLLPGEWGTKMEWAVNVSNTQGEIAQELWGVSWRGADMEGREAHDVVAHIDILTQIMANEAPPVD